MIRIVLIPEGEQNLFQLLREKESELAGANKGTFRTTNSKVKTYQIWKHSRYPGEVGFAETKSYPLVVEIWGETEDNLSQTLASFIGFLGRHLEKEIRTILIDFPLKPKRAPPKAQAKKKPSAKK